MSGRLHIHLDPVGGIAGDMFVAALLDAFPEHAGGAIAAVRAAGLGEDIGIERQPYRDEVLVGSRFAVTRDHTHMPGEDGHRHVHWCDLRARLLTAPLEAAIGARAVAIFELLAEAEAFVHGVAVDQATFHEVGAWDSIADIVAAAFLIETIGAERWSVGALPLGGGRVRCAHGELPVPAPATARLLRGFAFHDDGRSGERVTPTGAAILRHLEASEGLGSGKRTLLNTGHGFGTRRLEGMSNVLRALVFEHLPDEATSSMPLGSSGDDTDTVAVLSFEVDDQTPEDLAIAQDHLRDLENVLDVLQIPVVGKKGRMAANLRLLVRPHDIEPVIAACFAETTTLGVRWHVARRAVLARAMASTDDGTRVKLAQRPGGAVTAKVESDDLAGITGHAARGEVRRSAESEALSKRAAGEDEG